jgi:uncharacterized protein YndB with AHSA1/START domain
MQIGMSGRSAARVLLIFLFWRLGVALGSDAWRLISDREGVRIYHAGTTDAAVPEMRAEIVFDAPPERVYQVITDYDHFGEFVPDVAQSRVIRCAGDLRWVHQRLEFARPVAPREYVLQINDRLHPAHGVYARIDWTSVPPAEYGVQTADAVAPRRFTGFWVLRPTGGDNVTAAAYGVQFDAGGLLPGWLVRPMTDRYALSVIDAVRERIRRVTGGPPSRVADGASAPDADPSTGGAKPPESLAASTSADISAEPVCATTRPLPGGISGGSRPTTHGVETSALGGE